MRDSLRAEMAAKGIREASSGKKADLAIARHVFLQEKVSVQQYTDWGYYSGAWPYSYGTYRMWAGAPRTFTDVRQYSEGTMILDFVDSRTGKLVFRGTGTAVATDPQANSKKIQKAVEKIVAALPVAQKP